MTVAAVPLAEAAAGAGAGAEGAAAGAGASGAARGAGSAAKGAGKGSGGRSGDLLTGAGLSGLGKGKGPSKALPKSGARKVLIAEFALCMVILAFSPMTGKAPTASAFMKRASAIMGLFFLLGLVSTGGRGASRASAGFGGLVTLVLLISDRSIFTVLTKKFQPGVGETDSDLGGLDAQDSADDNGTGDPTDDPGAGGVAGAAGAAVAGLGRIIGDNGVVQGNLPGIGSIH